MAQYHCDDYNCIVTELPCPHCGASDHKEVRL
jgi:predicted RNA-binding protein with PUA domain